MRVRLHFVLRNGNSLASCVAHGMTRYLLSCICNLWLFLDDTTGVSVPLRAVTSSSGLHPKMCLGIGTYLEWTGNRCLSESGTTHEPSSRVSM